MFQLVSVPNGDTFVTTSCISQRVALQRRKDWTSSFLLFLCSRRKAQEAVFFDHFGNLIQMLCWIMYLNTSTPIVWRPPYVVTRLAGWAGWPGWPCFLAVWLPGSLPAALAGCLAHWLPSSQAWPQSGRKRSSGTIIRIQAREAVFINVFLKEMKFSTGGPGFRGPPKLKL